MIRWLAKSYQRAVRFRINRIRVRNTARGGQPMSVTINGTPYAIQPEERLIDLINRSGVEVPHVCYHPQLGPIQSCDTCMVEVDGQLMRACGTAATYGMN